MGIFADYEYERIPELENVPKVSIEEIANKPADITFVKIVSTKDGDKAFVKFKLLADDSEVFIFTGATKIVSTLARIIEDFGEVPDGAPVVVSPFATKNGTGYKLKDAY